MKSEEKVVTGIFFKSILSVIIFWVIRHITIWNAWSSLYINMIELRDDKTLFKLYLSFVEKNRERRRKKGIRRDQIELEECSTY